MAFNIKSPEQYQYVPKVQNQVKGAEQFRSIESPYVPVDYSVLLRGTENLSNGIMKAMDEVAGVIRASKAKKKEINDSMLSTYEKANKMALDTKDWLYTPEQLQQNPSLKPIRIDKDRGLYWAKGIQDMYKLVAAKEKDLAIEQETMRTAQLNKLNQDIEESKGKTKESLSHAAYYDAQSKELNKKQFTTSVDKKNPTTIYNQALAGLKNSATALATKLNLPEEKLDQFENELSNVNSVEEMKKLFDITKKPTWWGLSGTSLSEFLINEDNKNLFTNYFKAREDVRKAEVLVQEQDKKDKALLLETFPELQDMLLQKEQQLRGQEVVKTPVLKKEESIVDGKIKTLTEEEKKTEIKKGINTKKISEKYQKELKAKKEKELKLKNIEKNRVKVKVLEMYKNISEEDIVGKKLFDEKFKDEPEMWGKKLVWLKNRKSKKK